MSNKKENLVVGLDIGTTKICAIVGSATDSGLDIVGIGTSPSAGLRKGVVINIESTVGAIRKALQEAELMAGCEIKSVFAGIAGGHIKGFNSQGVIAIKNREVNNEDVRRVIDAAKAIAIPMDREVIHILPIAQRPPGYNPLGVKNIDPHWVRRLGQSGKDCFDAILARDLESLGASMNECMRCWEAILPNTVMHPAIPIDLRAILSYYQSRFAGAMYSGCGGGYLFVASADFIPGSFHAKIRAGE